MNWKVGDPRADPSAPGTGGPCGQHVHSRAVQRPACLSACQPVEAGAGIGVLLGFPGPWLVGLDGQAGQVGVGHGFDQIFASLSSLQGNGQLYTRALPGGLVETPSWVVQDTRVAGLQGGQGREGSRGGDGQAFTFPLSSSPVTPPPGGREVLLDQGQEDASARERGLSTQASHGHAASGR